jgi:hypothetical protein
MTQAWTPPTDNPPTWREPGYPPPPVPANRRPAWLGVAIAAVVALACSAIGFFLGRDSATPDPSEAASAAAGADRLRSAFEACRDEDPDGTLSLQDDGSTIVVATLSEYGDTSGMDCVLAELDTPSSITAQIGRTTAMMGVQDAEHNGLSFSWTYHPDNGVNMVISQEETPN